MSTVLNIEKLRKEFGGVVATDDLSLDVREVRSTRSSGPTAPARRR
ncbi:MAG: hypothetical protein R3E68_07880 [Burkholderiaceae bacterium]